MLGEPCGDRFDLYSSCRGDSFCDVDAGRCVAPPVAGQRCGAFFLGFGLCAQGLVCADGGTCQPYPGVGQPCAWNACASGAWCSDAGTCLARAGVNAPCAKDIQCTGGLCSRVNNRCSTQCNFDGGDATGCSCPEARPLMFLLVFAAVLLPRKRRVR
jgi:hypothetical protein